MGRVKRATVKKTDRKAVRKAAKRVESTEVPAGFDPETALKATESVQINANLIHSTYQVGASGASSISRPFVSPVPKSLNLVAAHFQPRHRNQSLPDAFAVRLVNFFTLNAATNRFASVRIHRIDSPNGWTMDLSIDVLWVVA
jgi:hypothetical protein